MTEYTFLSATILLILIMDPFGNVPIFLPALKNVERKEWALIREHLIAFSVLLGFMFSGQHFMSALGLSGPSLQIAGAVVLGIIALRMIFPPTHIEKVEVEQEPFIVPLAIPLIAGPSALATVLLLASQAPDKLLTWVGALVTAVTFSFIILFSALKLKRFVDDRIITATERLMGLVLVAISVEMFVSGVKQIILTI